MGISITFDQKAGILLCYFAQVFPILVNPSHSFFPRHFWVDHDQLFDLLK